MCYTALNERMILIINADKYKWMLLRHYQRIYLETLKKNQENILPY
jgi:hypothetical protein